MIHGMKIKTARRYVTAIKQIDQHVDRIHALADILSLLINLDDERIWIDPRSLGCIGQTLATEVLRITERLDDEFVSVAEVERALKSLEESKRTS
ncbi:MAG: hypothetical protein GY868_18525 [Deltaproteobacteria bacterium]|nr:hypothetical protein [Deltaproteobacteria bacterium]